MDLPLIWFVIIAVFWTGFFVLEGFDFGVGALHTWVGRDEAGRRVAINSIGPLWDGNEVWLITAGAATFAAFPAWYATWFSALYLALVLVLLALIVRGVSFEFRGKHDSSRWRGTWTATLVAGSVLAPLLIGVGLGDLLAGLPIDSSGEFTGSFLDLLTPFGLLLGSTLLVLSLLHGSTFLAVKTDGEVRDRAIRAASGLRWAGAVLVVAAAAATWALGGRTVLAAVLGALSVLGVVASAMLVGRGRDGWSFVATAVTIGATVAALFAGLYPNVLVSSTDPAYSLTVAGTASGQYALTVMTWVAVVLFPVVLAYQAWTAYVFRARISSRAGLPTALPAA
ncbi:MAG: cytochrome d ubiquinol oxidase subunit II [Actinobacteria bacterium]|jgi:cytochrome d ubiquinol oxidase subunit II|nr:cytochrome d ubiquinol oxidase subunit II [Actinomycetota bacterium]